MTYILVFPAKHELSSKRLRDPQPQKIDKLFMVPFFPQKICSVGAPNFQRTTCFNIIGGNLSS